MRFDMNELRQLELEKLVRINKHSTEALWVVNYSEATQVGRLWSRHPALIHCRGLVVDVTGTVVGNCLSKFGSLGEFPGTNITTLAEYENVEVTDKLDGSCVILTQYHGKVIFSTRGTFESDQALAAARLWQEMRLIEPLDPALSYVWEYTSPTNRVVLRYDDDRLTLIGVVHTASGEEYSYARVHEEAQRIGVQAVSFAVVDGPWMNLTTLQQEGIEGFVLYFPDQSIRVKIKLAAYLEMHRLRNNKTDRYIYEALVAGMDLSSMYALLDTEDHSWLETTVARYEHEFSNIVAQAATLAQEVLDHNLINPWDRDQRKAMVYLIQQRDSSLLGVTLDILEGKEYTKRVWRLVRE